MSLLKLTIYLSLILISQKGICQFIGPYEINVAGKETKNSNYLLSYTIGGNIITKASNNFSVTQGVHQPNNISVNSSITTNQLNVVVFPNPAKEIIHICFKNIEEPTICTVNFTNMQGIVYLIDNTKYYFAKNKSIIININNLPVGIYLVSLISDKSKLQIASFKLMKTQ